MSEFYALRRSTIKDTTALILFVFGWLGSAPFAWPYITAGFESGDPTAGVFRFAVVVFGAGIGCGLAGLGLGSVGGWMWERSHRRWRVAHPHAEQAAPQWDSVERERRAIEALPALPPIVYDDRSVTSAQYAPLIKRVTGETFDKTRTTRALKATQNICAWDGDKLIGIARILTDGFLAATLAEIAVDPDYQRRGVGRELMNRAFNATPRGTLVAIAPLAFAPFFERIGCERGVAGFAMRRPARRSATA
ncbi:MAG TPA: GNAT family N-acetyltransferase [Gemmatimonadaceae bacterium]|nr:GNAT family N-acetyltransferase [Gemmatimonadaceae bacterium]